MQIKSMPLKEQRNLMKLIAKHGDDHKAMERDLVLNVQQETAVQLGKRLALLKRLQAL